MRVFCILKISNPGVFCHCLRMFRNICLAIIYFSLVGIAKISTQKGGGRSEYL